MNATEAISKLATSINTCSATLCGLWTRYPIESKPLEESIFLVIETLLFSPIQLLLRPYTLTLFGDSFYFSTDVLDFDGREALDYMATHSREFFCQKTENTVFGIEEGVEVTFKYFKFNNELERLLDREKWVDSLINETFAVAQRMDSIPSISFLWGKTLGLLVQTHRTSRKQVKFLHEALIKCRTLVSQMLFPAESVSPLLRLDEF